MNDDLPYLPMDNPNQVDDFYKIIEQMKENYQKIVEWDIIRYKEKPMKDNIFQWVVILYMIPFFGQLIFE